VGNSIIVIAKIDYLGSAVTSGRENINKICKHLLDNYQGVKYRASKILPSVTIDAYEMSDDDINKMAVELRNLEFVDSAEKVTNVI
jgi:hypothetical protein